MIRKLYLALTLSIALPVMAGELTVIHLAPYTGAVARDAEEVGSGIRIAIAAINASGGINGNTLKLEIRDDGYKPDETVRLLREAGKSNALAVLVPVGSASMNKLLKENVLEEVGIPVVGVVPGAESLRNPINPYLYHTRAGDADQIAKIIEYDMVVGQKRVLIAYAEIPFGNAGMKAAVEHLKAIGTTPAAKVGFALADAGKVGERISDEITRSSADTLLLIAPAAQSAAFIKSLRGLGLTIPIATLSYADASIICAPADPETSRGVAITQVVPNLRNTAIPIVRDFRDAAARFAPGIKLSQFSLEGFIATRTLIEALRHDTQPTRESLRHALDNLHKVDLGGYQIDFSATKHTGSEFVDISVIGKDCKVQY